MNTLTHKSSETMFEWIKCGKIRSKLKPVFTL